MASNKLEVSELDFDNIKSNLKTFLQNQSEFQDYDFEGSGFAVLLDVLAYNTHYLGFNANMLANEMYLDSADIRKNIVSLAKMLGYTPTSAKSPSSVIDILINNATGATVTMAKGTTFTTSVDGTSYEFVTNASHTITPTNGVYKFSNISIYEGTLVTFKYTVDSSDPDQRFVIPSVNADTSTLKIQVQNSLYDTATSTYSLASGITSLDSISKSYFLQEGEDGKFETYFGDGVIGKSLSDGNIVIMEYMVSNKDEANGATAFALSGTIGGFSDVTITSVSSAQGGSEAQTKESIRYNAPLQYSAQDRAVTTTDYETKVQELYPNALSVSAWGGEDDETPIYGVVKIAIKAASGSTLTETTKASIIAKLKKYNVASVRPQIIDPETTTLLLTSSVKFDEKATTKTAETLKSEITTVLTNYNTNTLQKFDSMFRYSKVVELIDKTDTSILSNITTLQIRKTFTPTFNTSTKYDIFFRNSIYNPHTGHNIAAGGIISSSGFKVNGDTTNIYYLDDDGSGNIRRYYFTGSVRTYSNSTQGTVNYATGQITINSLNVSSIENIRGLASTVLEITVQPNSNDVVPVRDQILEIDTTNSNITVTSDSFVGGSSDAGVGYTTTSSYNT
jgi:hypothetical protein|tara:strand:+ start:2896 stop:4758 length:1863 start_codon:yes stop_codon:yes gene_type:complete